MNQPTMTNEQFAIWVALGQGMDHKLFDRAQIILDWIEKNNKKPSEPIKPKK